MGWLRWWLCLGTLAAAGLGAEARRAAQPEAGARTTVEVLLAIEGRRDFPSAIEVLEAADVAADVAAAKRAKDRRLIGFVVHTLFVPGLDPAAKNKPPYGYAVVRIKGTSDDLDELQARFQSLLSRYAREYNRGLLAERAE